MGHGPGNAAPTRATTSLAGLAAVLLLAACTATVTGQGRRLAGGPGGAGAPGSSPGAASGAASGGPSPGSVPSGAPVPMTTRYPDSTPEIRSYLYARDATYAASDVAVAGVVAVGTLTATVTATFGFDVTTNDLVGDCRLTVGGATAAVRGIGDDTWADAPAAFWTAYGKDAGTAAAAAGRWVTVTEKTGLVAACNNDVAFLSQFEPQSADDLRTGVDSSGSSGPSYFIEDRTTGVTTLIDRAGGSITGIRTSAGTLTLTYPGTAVTVAKPSPVVAVPGI